MPLMRFLDRLFNSGVLSGQDGTLPEDFAINLVKLVSKETARCSAPLKLLEAIPVLCQVAGIRAEKKVVLKLIELLCFVEQMQFWQDH